MSKINVVSFNVFQETKAVLNVERLVILQENVNQRVFCYYCTLHCEKTCIKMVSHQDESSASVK